MDKEIVCRNYSRDKTLTGSIILKSMLTKFGNSIFKKKRKTDLKYDLEWISPFQKFKLNF